jgi:hypothetical protein
MKPEERISAFVKLGDYLRNMSEAEFDIVWPQANAKNPWFTKESVKSAFEGISFMLNGEKLAKWAEAYNLNSGNSKKVGLVLPGNIPLAGFHDLMSVLISGHSAIAKLSSDDPFLPEFVAGKLISFNPGFKERIRFEERLAGIDAVIATGSDNSARYFTYYFSKYPNIIRKNRNSVGILTGRETEEDFTNLGTDIFTYFGLGCRSISKLYVPKGYSFQQLLDNLNTFHPVTNHYKYNNNYDYNKSIYLVNSVPHLDTGFLLVKEDKQISSPISVLFYEQYEDLNTLKIEMDAITDKIQCIVSGSEFTSGIPFGSAQRPELWDYADKVDTMRFLEKIKG